MPLLSNNQIESFISPSSHNHNNIITKSIISNFCHKLSRLLLSIFHEKNVPQNRIDEHENNSHAMNELFCHWNRQWTQTIKMRKVHSMRIKPMRIKLAQLFLCSSLRTRININCRCIDSHLISGSTFIYSPLFVHRFINSTTCASERGFQGFFKFHSDWRLIYGKL